MSAPRPDSVGPRMLKGALWGLAGFLVATVGWTVWKAVENPDVRLRRPGYVDGAFDHSFWLPFLATVVVGSALVGAVLWTALRRMRRGEELYEGRIGKGLRRRGERFVDDET